MAGSTSLKSLRCFKSFFIVQIQMVKERLKNAVSPFVCRRPHQLILLYTLREKFPSMRLYPALPWAWNDSKSLQVFRMSFLAQTVLKWHKHLLCLCRWALTSCFPFILQIRMSFLLDSHVLFCRTAKEAKHYQRPLEDCGIYIYSMKSYMRGRVHERDTRPHLAVEHFISRHMVQFHSIKVVSAPNTKHITYTDNR